MAVVGATMRELVERGGRIAGQRRALLIEGPSGSGKKTLAREIHAASARSARPLVEVACGSLPESLLDAHLFGHRHRCFCKGGDVPHVGAIVGADGGTVVFDAIDTVPAAVQEKLNRLLQLREVWPPTGLAVRVDVCVIVTTAADLRPSLAAETFLPILYHRLRVEEVVVPPLRDRRDEIVPLAEHFREVVNEEFGRRVPGFSAGAMELLTRFAWPGNVRELRNAVARAVFLGRGDEITPEDLPSKLRETV